MLSTTTLFADPKEAVQFVSSDELKTTSEKVSTFLFEKALLGQGATSPGAIGIAFPDGSVFGDEANVKFRYDATFMKAAADGAL